MERLDAATAQHAIKCLAVLASEDSGNCEEVLDDLCIVVGHHLLAKQRPPMHPTSHPVIEPWNTFSPTVFHEHSRFYPADFISMCRELKLPTHKEKLRTPNRCVCSVELGVFIVLRRLAVPDRWTDLEFILQQTFQWLCEVYQHTLTQLCSVYGLVVCGLDVVRLLPRLGEFAECVSSLTDGEGETDVVCVVDGKFGHTCRPRNKTGDNQRAVYNGHYRGHGVKLQGVLWMDGTMNAFVDTGRVHDSTLLSNSNFLEKFSVMYINGQSNRPAFVYGDPAYGTGTHLKRKGKGNNRSDAQKRRDIAMMSVRGLVEKCFAKLVMLFSHLDFKKKLKLWQTNTCDEFLVGVLFLNLHTCIYGSQMNALTCIDAPSVREYLHSVHTNQIVE
jgi:hypothetical protein